jgi:hypothetical protein
MVQQVSVGVRFAADPADLAMPSFVAVAAQLAMFVAATYYVSTRGFPSPRRVVAFLILMVGLGGCYQGFLLAVREDARLRDGTVIAGIVVDKRPEGPPVVAPLLPRAVALRVAHLSMDIRTIDYRYPCGGIRTCSGRDYVSAEYWSRLRVGDTVNVRQGWNEAETGRLDANPQLAFALWHLGLSAAIVYAAAALGGMLPKRRLEYLSAPAVVLAVEPMHRGDEQHWKVRFGYIDANGHAQESVDEVTVLTVKTGDDCVAVYRPNSPDLATLQILEAR